MPVIHLLSETTRSFGGHARNAWLGAAEALTLLADGLALVALVDDGPVGVDGPQPAATHTAIAARESARSDIGLESTTRSAASWGAGRALAFYFGLGV